MTPAEQANSTGILAGDHSELQAKGEAAKERKRLGVLQQENRVQEVLLTMRILHIIINTSRAR